MSENLKIQKATNLKDVYHILLEFDEVFNPHLHLVVSSLYDYAKKLSGYAQVYIAEVNNKLCGFMAYYLNSDTKIGYLTQIAVKPDYMGLGYAQNLLDTYIKDCKENKHIQLMLEVKCHNESAIKFYLKNGFERAKDTDHESFYMIRPVGYDEEKINVTQSSMPAFDDFANEIKDLWDSKWITNNGLKHQNLECELSAFLGVENVSLFTNGHLALEYIFEALDLKGEVITTSFTFASTTHAIVRSGLSPVFCDINPYDYTIDVNKIEALITDKTSAIVPVHVYGNLCDVTAIESIAKKYNLKVIYDAAHAFGVELYGRGIANFGDASMFSFHATKVFNTIEGGAVCCNNDYLKSKIDKLKNFGISSPETVEFVGGNAKMNEFQSAMGLCNLRITNGEIKKRKAVYNRYIERLDGVPGLKICKTKDSIKGNYAYFAVVFDGYKVNRDEMCQILKDNNIFARKYFYPLTSDFDCYNKKYNSDSTPIARHIAGSVLTLPMYADLSLANVDRICDVILFVQP